MSRLQSSFMDDVAQDIADAIVTRFRLIAHKLDPVAPGGFNHWSIDLLHANGSVRLNMKLLYPNSKIYQGQLTVRSYASKGIPKSAVKYWEFATAENLAVYYVLQLIIDNWRQEYDMHASGDGCRYWIYTFMADCRAKGYVSRTSMGNSTVVTVDDIIEYKYLVGQQPVPLTMLQGRFWGNGRPSMPRATSSSSSQSLQTQNLPTYFHGGKYYNGNTEVEEPINVWVKNESGWASMNREKYWRLWDGSKYSYK
ncbi:hypothetical protein B7494_g6237 [Chlorociboria aeruginascens]|nr:hypothetical protein B7494_g6237 [Chlorociboria aeruginascens]